MNPYEKFGDLFACAILGMMACLIWALFIRTLEAWTQRKPA